MSTNRYDFWIHGHTTIVESPDRVDQVHHDHDQGMYVKQNGGQNWFGIPLTRPTTIAGERAVLDHIRMRYVLKGAHVLGVEFRRGGMLIEAIELEPEGEIQPTEPKMYNKVVFCEKKERYRFASIMLWVHIEFDDPAGEIWFHDTGTAYFAEQIGGPASADETAGEEDFQLSAHAV